MKHKVLIDFRLSAGACIWGALALLVLPIRWILAAAAAAVFHECCHLLALKLCGVAVHGITVGVDGIRIETEPMGAWQELICALAGPVGSLTLLCLIRYAPLIAICAGIQGMYNLIPIYPFDGGRILGSILEWVCPDKKERVMERTGRSVSVLIGALGLYAFCVLKLGVGSLIAAFLLLQKKLPRKIPCKEGLKRVQ